MVLLHGVMTITLLSICLDVGGILLETNFKVILSTVPFHQLYVDHANVTVVFGNIWIPLDRLLIFLEGLWIFACIYSHKYLP